MKFSGKVSWDDLITFWVNSGKRVGGSKVNLPAIAQSQLHSLGGGICCAPHHCLFYDRFGFMKSAIIWFSASS